MNLDKPWEDESVIRQSMRIMDSFERWLKRPLCDRSGSQADQAYQLFHVPFVVVSHGTQEDPILNYGNRTALDLWEADFAALTKMPSRKTAEPVHRDERASMLERTTRDGYIDDYSGVRISVTGKRFHIAQAIVWNLVDQDGNPAGQAATFADWQML